MSAKPAIQHPAKGEHIEPIHGFDQTNGIAPGQDEIEAETDEGKGTLLANAVASNAVNIGFFGGGF